MSLRWIAVASLMATSRLDAQADPRALALRDSSPGAIMAHVRQGTYPFWFIDMLRMTPGSVSQAKLDALGDSLVNRAVAAPAAREMATGNWTPSAADALAWAGDRGRRDGVPYGGALDRLIRIHQQARNYTMRTAALAAMPGVVGRERGLAYLKTIATSDDPTSAYAISVLIIDANGGRWYGPTPSKSERKESEAILRSLDESRAVRNDEARRLLDRWAQRHRA